MSIASFQQINIDLERNIIYKKMSEVTNPRKLDELDCNVIAEY